MKKNYHTQVTNTASRLNSVRGFLKNNSYKLFIAASIMLLRPDVGFAQSCAITLNQTPSTQLCAGAQVTLNPSTSFVNIGTGVTGSLTINSTYYTDATRAAVVGTNASNTSKVRVSSTTGFASGNEVMVITMIDGNTSGNLVGQYEFMTISSVSGDTLLFSQNHTNAYTASATLKHQVIKVPHYTNLVIASGGIMTCNAWNGATGGVVCFRASGTISVNSGGYINADGKGYRGTSHGAITRNYNGGQGEGIYGQGFTGGGSNGSNGTWNNANGNGGGGGTGTGDSGGGGGGSHGSAGSAAANYGGHYAGLGGLTVGSTNMSSLFFGGAGGEGGGDEDGAFAGSGGNGGGIIYVAANSIIMNGAITCYGTNGGTGSNAGGGSGCGMAGGGGGAGGSIYLSLNGFSGTGSNIVSTGGAAGANNGCGGAGANGGSGRIRMDMSATIPVTNPAGYQGTVPPLTGLTYSWSNGATTSSIVVSPSVTTNYSVTITSTTGCNGSGAAINVAINPLPVISISGGNSLCSGTSLTLSASGASTYTWNTGSNASSIVINPTSLSSYSLTGTSAAGCFGNTAVNNVTVNPNPTITINSGSICSGNSFTLNPNGAISYTIQGGSSTVSPLSTSSYSLSGTNSFGCKGNIATSTVIVNLSPVVTINGGNTMCSGSSLNLTASGAINYLWNDNSSAANLSINLVSNTNFSVTGTDALGCTASAVKSITVNALPVVLIAGTNEICSGFTSTLTASGANSYLWNNGRTGAVNVITPSSDSTYIVIGTSIVGCTATAISNVTVHALPVVTLTGNTSLCSGESATLTANGADSYSWSTNTSGNSLVVSPALNTVYSLTGTSINGCNSAPVSTTLIVNPLPVVTITGTSAICAGDVASLTASGASSYLWNDNSTSSVIVVSPSVTSNYSATGTSTDGCIGYSSITTLSVNALPLVLISGTNAVCAGNSTTLTAGGANSYAWNNGLTSSIIAVTPSVNSSYTVVGTSVAGCVASTTKTLTVYSLPLVSVSGNTAVCAGQSLTLNASGAGTYVWNDNTTNSSLSVSPLISSSYSVAGTDLNGCQGNSLPLYITVNTVPVLSIIGTNSICNGSSVSLTVTGAVSYLWSTASTNSVLAVTPTSNTTYTVTGMSTSGCSTSTIQNVYVNALPLVLVSGTNSICLGNSANITASGATTYSWSTGASTSTLVVSPASNSTYTVIGTNTAGCIGTAVKSITVNALPLVSVSGNSAVCLGSSATLTANGAATYSWNTGVTSSSLVVSPSSTTSYSVQGTSLAGCVGNFIPKTITVNPLPATAINGTNAVCAGGSVSLTASGANTYSWNTTATSSLLVITPASNTTYTLTGMNAFGCSNVALKTVSVNALPVLSISGNTFICAGQSTSLTATGANTYSWSNGSTSSVIVITPSSSNAFNLTGYSNAGCQATTVSNVTVNALPVLNIGGTISICEGTALNLTASGANSYSWSNGSTGAVLVATPTVNTTYSVTGTNTAGCMSSSIKGVTVNPLPVLSISGLLTLCYGDSTLLSASGASSYTWNNGSNAPTTLVSPTVTTIYSVTAMSSLGCSGSKMDSVIVNPLPVILVSGASAICSGDSATWNLSGASSYTWNNGSYLSTLVLSPTVSSNYTVMGSGIAGCVGQAVDSLKVNPNPIITVTGLTQICEGNSTTLTAAGANTYSWSNGNTTNTTLVSPSGNTTYYVSGVNLFNCTSITSTTVQVDAVPVLTLNTSALTLCSGETATLSVSGANSYTWNSGELASELVVTPNATTQYTVTGTNKANCNSSSSIELFVSDCTGLSSHSANTSSIKMYPNPNNGEFVIELDQNSNASISITDIMGRTLLVQKADSQNHVDLKAYTNGIYFVRVLENNVVVYKGSIVKH